MTQIFKGRIYKGWTIIYPTLGTNYLYLITNVDKPGVQKTVKTLGDAQRWIDKQGK